MARQIGDLPHAIEDSDRLARDLAGRRPSVFLDYDGTLTPIVDRPEDALISESMREAVRRLAERLPVCVVSGRDRRVVQALMGVDDLIVAGSHGFDIWSPAGGEIQREEGENFAGLLEGVEARLREELGGSRAPSSSRRSHPSPPTTGSSRRKSGRGWDGSSRRSSPITPTS